MNIHRFAALGLLFLLTHSVLAADTRELRFPDLKDGRLVLSVDTHTHSVFSDGHVWPTVRVWEANKDRLDAMAITEHLEYQPYRKDIPHPIQFIQPQLACGMRHLFLKKKATGSK